MFMHTPKPLPSPTAAPAAPVAPAAHHWPETSHIGRTMTTGRVRNDEDSGMEKGPKRRRGRLLGLWYVFQINISFF